jgi:nucleoside-diphosphate-sugar epimerase
MRILISGSTGFVGRHLVPKLLSFGHSILEITIEPEVSHNLYGSETIKYVVTDDQEGLKNKIKEFNPEITIHLASYLTSEDDYLTLQKLLNTNITFFCRLLDALKFTDLKLFVNTGTFAEYSKGKGLFDPAYLYSSTKTASRSFLDYYAKVYKFKQVTVVPYTIYGGNYNQKKIIDIIFDSIDSKVPVDLSPGEQILDFIHIDDVTDFYLKIVEGSQYLPDKVNFQLGTGTGTSLRQLALMIEKKTGTKPNINWGGKPYRQADVMYAVAEISNIEFWKPSISLEQGIELAIKEKYGRNL